MMVRGRGDCERCAFWRWVLRVWFHVARGSGKFGWRVLHPGVGVRSLSVASLGECVYVAEMRFQSWFFWQCEVF